MSSFFAYDFEFDNIPSQKFDLKIVTFEDGGLFSGVGSTDVSIISQRVLRKSRPYYLGRTQEPVLEFPLTFASYREITGLDRDMISAWLFGRSEYKKLYIFQDDLNGAYFNCFLTKPEPQYIGNLNYAFKCQVVCDSPWAYGPEHTISGSVAGGGSTLNYINIYNSSSEDDYLYPTLYFNLVATSNPEYQRSLSFTNTTDSLERAFHFAYMYSGDEVTVDNDLQIVTLDNSYTSFPRYSDITGEKINTILECFDSKHWFRLLPRNNQILVSVGNYSTLNYTIRWTERFKIGG